MSLVSKFGVSEISKCFTVKNGVISTSELKDAISMSADGDTEVLKISAQTKDPLKSATFTQKLHRHFSSASLVQGLLKSSAMPKYRNRPPLQM